jgi:mannitol 2-dehydrogenase
MSAPPHDVDLTLRSSSLHELGERGLRVPGYDRSRLRPRVLHIGVGGFHRAHLAMYLDQLAEKGSDWGICGAGLLPHDQEMADALSAQEFLYTFTELGPGEPVTHVIGSIIDFVLGAADPEPVVDRIARAETAIVSMTISESGYEGSARNDRTFDVIAAGLARRRASGHGGLTVLSCDNLPGNGAVARRCVLAAAERLDPGLAGWVGQECSVPSSMVDRITPQTKDADRERLRATYGLEDRWPVVGEPFWQWVLEDDFAAGRPAFDDVGVLFSDDVRAWELYKLRLLNAGHSSIAYLCALAGMTYVDEAMATPEVRAFLEGLLYEEAVPTLEAIPGHPREDYARVVLERFANTGVRDQIARLCIDGTSKFPTFLIPTLVRAVQDDTALDRAACALAGWAHYLADLPVEQQAQDLAAATTRPRAVAATRDPAEFLQDNPVFPTELATDARFGEAFCRSYRQITQDGPLKAMAAAGR